MTKTIEQQNDERRKEIVQDILKYPHPGNSRTFQRLVNLGETPDYSPADEGEPPQGIK